VVLGRRSFRTKPFLRRYLQRIASKVSDIDDLLQEIYARLLAMPDIEIERVRDVGALLSKTIHAVILEHLRRQRVVSLDTMVAMQSLKDMPPLPWADKQKGTLARNWRCCAGSSRACRGAAGGSSSSAKSMACKRKRSPSVWAFSQHKVEQQIATGVRLCASLLFTIAAGNNRSLLAQLLLHGTAR